MEAIASPLLPDDVIEEIFLRLRVKQLTRLKCLSKQWKSRIEFRCFVVRSQRDRPTLILMMCIFILLGSDWFNRCGCGCGSLRLREFAEAGVCD
ncbi:unnamed protein product [Microthlaspi erraticum]|uniref:F-box domain-containing protein n=1 Tax=Microthlaspi erraticum TaxID=1685480 RepID=A0A6D2JE36_9BRAS|nr:unnamed protein product [Microthlaspi erraticum]